MVQTDVINDVLTNVKVKPIYRHNLMQVNKVIKLSTDLLEYIIRNLVSG